MGTGTADGARGSAVVIGAGIVGVCCALSLQEDGWSVTMLDPEPPGSGASRGNAGILSAATVLPLSTPGLLRQVPRMLLDPNSALKLNLPDLPGLLPWLLRFSAASAPARVEAGSRALASLAGLSLQAHARLALSAGVPDLVRSGGYLEVYRSAREFQASARRSAFRAARGVVEAKLAPADIAGLEPALAPDLVAGVHLPESGWTPSPYRYAQALAAAVLATGGALERVAVEALEPRNGGGIALHCGARSRSADLVVLAAGARSRQLARCIGLDLPLMGHRGYHAMLPEPGIRLTRPVAAVDSHIVLTPMEDGLCVTGTLELASLDAPPRYEHARLLAEAACTWLPGLEIRGARYWMGHRPALPDSLPVIAPAPDVPRVLLALGHGGMGLTFAAVTGELIADLAAGRQPAVDLHPFRADRFR